ncbi:MAG: transporter substrate-binding domain-containing protein [Desulfobacterales bacterium]|nr:transporter substrate-binding domain-containing protein [Desulfobacterales bacterium]
MKNLLFFVVFLSFFLLIKIEIVDGKEIFISGTEWEPYTGEHLLNKGFLAEITVEAFKKVGYDVTVKLIPWIRAIEETKIGKFHALIGASYTEDRTNYFAYPKYAWENYMHIFTQNDKDMTYTTLEKLCPGKVGLLRGSYLVERIRKNVNCLKIEEANTVLSNIEKLIAKRINYMIDSKDSVYFYINTDLKEKKNMVKIIYPPLELDKVYTVISKNIPNYETILNDYEKGIELIKQDGTYQKILEKHGY